MTIMRFGRPDRCQYWEMGYWADVLQRWYGEGLQKKYGLPATILPGDGLRGEGVPHSDLSTTRFRDKDVHEQLGMDSGLDLLPVNSGPQPQFDTVVFEETDEFRIFQDECGIRKRINKKDASIPEFLDWQVKDRRDFERLKEERFRPGLGSRVPREWPQLLEGFRKRDYPLSIGAPPVGFYGFLRYMMGEERLLTNFYYDPDLIRDMMRFFAEFWVDLWEEALSQVDVDCAHFWEDIAYRNGPLISPAMFREFMMPCYRKITGFLKARGVRVILVDCDGNLDELTPLFLEAGLTGVYPIEVQAGNDLVALRKKYPRMHILGGINKLELAKGRPAIDRELEKIPALIASGGYIPFVDHLVPPEVSWDDFVYYRGCIREIADGKS